MNKRITAFLFVLMGGVRFGTGIAYADEVTDWNAIIVAAIVQAAVLDAVNAAARCEAPRGASAVTVGRREPSLDPRLRSGL